MGDDIYARLNDDGYILLPVGISPHGKWGPIFHNHLTGKRRGDDYKFPWMRPEAEKCINGACLTQHQLE